MILVTGATGLVGAHLCLSLLQQNTSFVALYRREKKKQVTLDFLANHLKDDFSKQIIWRKADLTHLPDLTLAFEGITQVYHCAAYVSMAYFKRDYLHEVNQIGTSYVTHLCVENQIKKLVYVSSIAALGSDTQDNRIDEDTPWNPRKEKTPYAYSKYGAELEVWRCAQEGIPVAIVNPGVILGIGMPNTPLSQLVKRVKKGVGFYPQGKTAYVTVEDVVKVMLLLMQSPIKNERFILAAENWSYKQIIAYVAEKLNRKSANRPLLSFYLWTAWVFESVVSFLGLRKKFLSKALIATLGNTLEIDGSKVTQSLPFSYTPITPYLAEKLR